MNQKEELLRKGYFILENVFTNSEINKFKNIILDYIKKNKCIRNASGITIPDFLRHKDLINIGLIKENKKIIEVLDNIFDKNYRFCNHNDIGINRIVGWHKDTQKYIQSIVVLVIVK